MSQERSARTLRAGKGNGAPTGTKCGGAGAGGIARTSNAARAAGLKKSNNSGKTKQTGKLW